MNYTNHEVRHLTQS